MNANSSLAIFSFSNRTSALSLQPLLLHVLAIYRILFVIRCRLDFEFGASRAASLELALHQRANHLFKPRSWT
jgi:hypothetical protein